MPDGDQFIPPDAGREKPTPEETAKAYRDLKTQSDLTQMLEEVKKLTGGKEVVGPDGKPVKDPEERRAAMQVKFDEQRKQKIQELGARVHHLSENDPDFASCLSLLREGHCLIALALSEMSVLEGVDDEVIGFSNEFFKNAIAQDMGDDVDNLMKRLEKNVMTFLANKSFQLRRLMERRKQANDMLVAVHPNNEPTVLLDCLHDLGMNTTFSPMGMVHVVFAEGFESEHEAPYVTHQRLKKAGYHTIYLTSKEIKGGPCIPEKWWIGACEREKTINSVLNPILKKRPQTQILIVSSLDKMLGEKKREEISPKHRQQALLRIVRWCMDNQVLGFIFSEETAEKRPYLGRAVTLRKGGRDVDGSGVRDEGGPEVGGASADRGGQPAEGSGEDSGGPGEEEAEADAGSAE